MTDNIWQRITPQPWKYNRRGFIIGSNTEVVANVAGVNPDNIRANAYLIAAAPDLLAVCEALWDAYTAPDERWRREDMWLAVAAAIAQTRGETS